MLVTVRIHGVLPVETGAVNGPVQLASGATVAVLLTELGLPKAAPVAAIVDGRAARRDQVLKDGSSVELMAHLTGG